MHIQQKYIVHSSGGREAPNPDTEIEVSWKVPPWILYCALLGASRGRGGGWGLGEPSGMASLQRLLSRQLNDMSWYGYWRDRVLQAGETVKAVCNISETRERERSEGDTEGDTSASSCEEGVEQEDRMIGWKHWIWRTQGGGGGEEKH